jgi:hypothetical protein
MKAVDLERGSGRSMAGGTLLLKFLRYTICCPPRQIASFGPTKTIGLRNDSHLQLTIAVLHFLEEPWQVVKGNFTCHEI